MKLLAFDGNSIVNRAFYGVRLLTTKDGKFYTNAVYGFMNIVLKMVNEYKPDCVAFAFDVKAPTFRHEMYSEYKAGRKGMPEELAQQMPILKELISALGYKIIECPGWEADDILGTLSGNCKPNDFCYIVTGDRDSLQLVKENVNVLLASTKNGVPTSTLYNIVKIKEDYLVDDPKYLIDIKAFQGDTSDNIPGVSGVGPKTAQELVSKYGTVDEIYSKIDALDIRDKLKCKLIEEKESAYLSRTLGTISKEVPIDTEYSFYNQGTIDNQKVTEILTKLEMFKMLERLNLKPEIRPVQSSNENIEINVYKQNDLTYLYNSFKKLSCSYFIFDNGVFYFSTTNGIAIVEPQNDDYVRFCTDFLNDSSINKFTYNCKQLYKLFYKYSPDIEVNGIKGDLMLSAYVLNTSSGDYSIKRVIDEYCGPVINDKNIDDNALYAFYLKDAFSRTNDLLMENKQVDLLNNIELPLSEVLSSMEEEGVQFDVVSLDKFETELKDKLSSITEEIYSAVGYEFNINSPKQLSEALFIKMQIPTKKKTKSGFSTNAEVLESLADDYPVVSNILLYRTYSKLLSTYCVGLKNNLSEDGRIHSNFNQVDTRTGRISSTEPNLQNIPVRTPIGKEMRKFFVSKPGYSLLDADYSQIELRVLASVAKDENMIKAFKEGEDIHTTTASQVFDLPPIMITPQLRSRAKAVNFGIVYGISPFSLSKQVGVTVYEADKYIKDYLSNFNGIAKYMTDVIEKAKTDGYVETIFGRRRYIPDIHNSNGNVRQAAERMAMNMPIQGAAADIIKIAMIKVFNNLKYNNFKARLILQVHDELIIECPDEEIDLVSGILKREMENAVNLIVKFQADVGVGKSWYEAKV